MFWLALLWLAIRRRRVLAWETDGSAYKANILAAAPGVALLHIWPDTKEGPPFLTVIPTSQLAIVRVEHEPIALERALAKAVRPR